MNEIPHARGPAAVARRESAAVARRTPESRQAVVKVRPQPQRGLLRCWHLRARTHYSFDSQYVERLIAGDPETERHFTEYFGDLLSLKLRSRLRSPAQAQDARQETFVRVLTALKNGHLTSPESLGAFVNSVCNNVVFELYRTSARAMPLADDREEQADEDQPNAEWRFIKAEERTKVREAIEGLPQRDRDLLRWLFFEERDKDDVCRELGIDRGYLRVLFHRAKQRFYERFTAGSDRE
jgi:RNA polymerase sigma-70 factor, ECF subfamily